MPKSFLSMRFGALLIAEFINRQSNEIAVLPDVTDATLIAVLCIIRSFFWTWFQNIADCFTLK